MILRKINRVIVAVMSLLLLLTLPVKADEEIETMIEQISKHGNTHLALTAEDLYGNGIEVGDTVNIRIGETYIEDVPYCYNYQNVPVGETLMLEDDGNISLAINNGSFADYYSLATKISDDSGTRYEDIVDEKVYIVLNRKAVYSFYDLTYSKKREDFENSSDEEFANFRVIDTSGMKENVLYRGCSPIDNQRGRAEISDELIEKNGIRNIINIIGGKEESEAFEGYPDSYYSSCDVLYVPIDLDFNDSNFEAALQKIAAYIADNEGPFYIHCLEGKDRTGYISATLEAYAGADYDEIEEDFMKSFVNYYGLKEGDETYEQIIEGFRKNFGKILDVDDVKNADLKEASTALFRKIGIDNATLKNLTGKISSEETSGTNNAVLVGAAVLAAAALIVAFIRLRKR